jgi:hypothetical protein
VLNPWRLACEPFLSGAVVTLTFPEHGSADNHARCCPGVQTFQHEARSAMRAPAIATNRTRSRRRAAVELLRAFMVVYLVGSAMLYGSRALAPARPASAPAAAPQLTAAK